MCLARLHQQIARHSTITPRPLEVLERRVLFANPSVVEVQLNADVNGDGVITDAGPAGEGASLAGLTVFIDENANRTLDVGEANAVTDADGYARFDTTGNMLVGIVLSDNQIVTRSTQRVFDQGEFRYRNEILVHDGGGRVQGQFFHDINKNGVRDDDEPGISNIGWRLVYDAEQHPTAEGHYAAISGADGTFDVAVPGGFHYRVVPKLSDFERFTLTTPDPRTASIPVADGQVVQLADIGLATRPAQVSGSVILDNDRDGRSDTGVGLAGATVYIDANDNGSLDVGERSTLTNAQGYYLLANLDPGLAQYNARVRVRGADGSGLSQASALVEIYSGRTAQQYFALHTVVPLAHPFNDYDGDGTPDIVFRGTDGKVRIGTYADLQPTSYALDVDVPAAEWKLVAMTDFDHDAQQHADLVLQNTTSGQVELWTMSSSGRTGTRVLFNGSPLWRVVGTADVNADGNADLIWRHAGTGQATVWRMNGTTVAGFSPLPWVQNLQWEILGVADMDQDGHSDLLWRNNTLKLGSLWLMESNTIKQFRGLSVAGPDWQLVGIGEFNEDGKPDLWWRTSRLHAPHPTYLWLMDTNRAALQLPRTAFLDNQVSQRL